MWSGAAEADPEVRFVCKCSIRKVLSGEMNKGMGQWDMEGEEDNGEISDKVPQSLLHLLTFTYCPPAVFAREQMICRRDA